MAVNEGPDRGYYAALDDARRDRTRKKKLPRERLAKPKEQPHGFFNSPRRRKPTLDELLEKFTAEMEAQGRGLAALDDEDGTLFTSWCERHGYEYW